MKARLSGLKNDRCGADILGRVYGAARRVNRTINHNNSARLRDG
ncbi:hypothetical protein Thpro_020401 [Acidihalobacter prosperus]|uniref:Uncharacterized protein n=1 Tax=Acidihalobacter prosperus TaxID=160660 RepID=A0A1A6C809_9GAMM|nr:hypothetical protein Thpro_020401 [Acidihalobacter prosperus]